MGTGFAGALTEGMRNSPPACAAQSSALETESRYKRTQQIRSQTTRRGEREKNSSLDTDNSELFPAYKSHR